MLLPGEADITVAVLLSSNAAATAIFSCFFFLILHNLGVLWIFKFLPNLMIQVFFMFLQLHFQEQLDGEGIWIAV